MEKRLSPEKVRPLFANYQGEFPISVDVILNNCCPDNNCNLDCIGGWLQNLEEMLQWKGAEKRKKIAILKEVKQRIENLKASIEPTENNITTQGPAPG
ncbi:MAG: hypothetical protein M0Z70_05155 [Nitrospiraceae bacterium]|nr:hypothetical protein [Nitrospiraceae bacterium]